MADRKVGEITVPTEPVSRATKITGFTFKSYDKNAGVLQFNIENQDGSPTDLIDATVRLFMYIYQGEEKKEFPIFDNQIITESYMQGIVKYRIPDMLLSYEGKVDANVYIDFPDGSHTDNLAFTFTIEKSIIDDNVQLNGEYYFKDFQQLLDGVKQEATDAVNAALTNIDTVSQNVTSAQNNLKAVEDKMNQTNQQIGDLGKLKKMYSNSIDFGNYDYSGNPNLIANINADSFSQGIGALSVVDDGDEVVITLDPNSTLSIYKVNSQPFLLVGKTYTMSVEIMLEDDFTGDPSKIALSYFNLPNKVPALTTPNTLTTAKGVWQKLTVTAKMTATINNAKSWYITLYNQDANNSLSGRLRLRHAKLEVGSTATPYQPNLLDAPYYLSKVPLGENIANKSVTFPIKTSAYAVYSYNNTENFIVGEKYVLTIKARKSATQTFNVRNVSNVFGDMKPVEGLTDIWVLEFTPTSIDKTYPAMLDIYQIPSNNVDACQIEWLKIEKGDTRTPNISQFKYFGEGLKDSNNPNDYRWDITPEYTEKGLNNTVSLTDPQSVEGLKNFEDGLQLKGISVVQDNFTSKAVTTKNITDFTEDSIVRFERWGRLVIANIEITNKSANFAGWKNLMAFPSGYTPISLVGWGGTLSNKTNRNPALSVYANSSGISVMISSADLPANQRCSGTVAYFTNDEWPQG